MNNMPCSNPLDALPQILTGDTLDHALRHDPDYSNNIRLADTGKRLIALNSLYDLYIPSDMGREIYSKLYLSMIRSMQKKQTLDAVRQRNNTFKSMSNPSGSGGIIGGSDSLSILGVSGIGKSVSIARSIQIMAGNEMIVVQEPLTKIIPFITVQCPTDCSVKGFLLDVMLHIDMVLESDYHDKAIHSRATTDILICMLSQILLNHVAVLVIDEVQNLMHRNGSQLVGVLTHLINNAGIAICFVGMPEASMFFQQTEYLARRTIGLRYDKYPFGEFFISLCEKAWSYQYTAKHTELSDGILRWLYEHSGGTPAMVISLIHDAQETAIISGREKLDIGALETAYRNRMGMLHGYMNLPVKSSVTKKTKSYKTTVFLDGIINPSEKGSVPKEPITEEFNIYTMAMKARKNHLDILKELESHIRVMEVTL